MTRTGSAGIWPRTSPATRIKDVPGDTEAGSRTQREIACLRNSQACLTRFIVRWRSKRRVATSSGVGADGPAGESAVASSRVRVRPRIFQQYPVFGRKWDQNFGAWPERFPPLSAPRTSEYR